MSTIISSAIVLSSSQISNNSGLIAYDNIFTDDGVTVSASDESSGFEKENAYDWKQYDWWKQASIGASWIMAEPLYQRSADYACVFGHNLHQVGGSVKPQYSDDGITWTDATSDAMPGDGSLLLFKFDQVDAAKWRLLITTTTGRFVIAGVMIGVSTILERDVTSGFSPATLSPEIENKTAKSEKGVNLGASRLSEGLSGSISLTNLTPLWVRDSWVPIINHLNAGYPCVFAWDYISHKSEAALIWKDGDIRKPSYSSPNFMSASLKYMGIA